MLNRESKRKVTGLAICLAPPAIVLAAVFLFQPQATLAEEADDQQAMAVPTPPAPIEVADSAIKAARHGLTLRAQPFGTSPLYYPVDRSVVVQPDQPDQPQTPRDLTAQVQMIIASPRGHTALIEGKPYRVGDILPKTLWQVTSIDPDAFSVALQHQADGRTVKLVVPLPGASSDD